MASVFLLERLVFTPRGQGGVRTCAGQLGGGAGGELKLSDIDTAKNNNYVVIKSAELVWYVIDI